MIDNITIVLIVVGVIWIARRAMLLDRQRPWIVDPTPAAPTETPPPRPATVRAPEAAHPPPWRERGRSPTRANAAAAAPAWRR